jgi:hypothetical protein
MKQPLELRKTRDFGQVINDSFTFLRENFKPLFKSLVIICGLFVLIGTVTSVFQYMSMMGLYTGRMNFDTSNTYEVSSYTYSYFLTAFFNGVVLLLLEVCIHLVTLAYISVYLQKGNQTPTFEEVWGYFKYYFFRVLGSGILLFLLIVIGCVLCFIPGIYLGNVFSLVIPIIVIENSSFSFAFNKSFQLIKDNWWFVLGVAFITYLIVGVASSFASVPLTIIPLAGKFFYQKSYTLPLLIIFSALRNILMLCYALPVIAIALCYFKLSEEKEGLGLLGRIENFGKTNDNNPTLPEEY